MNKQIRKLAAGLLVLYIALFAALNVIQVSKKDELNAAPQNNRQTIRDFNRPRGPIVTADGVVVARVDDLDRDGLRDLAVAVRDMDGIRGTLSGWPCAHLYLLQ